MLAQFAITFGAWLVLLFVCTNLVGFLVRGLVTDPEMAQLQAEGHDFMKSIMREHRKADHKANIVALILILAFLVALYQFWNAGVVVAALIIMAARIPDLIWEIKHGRKLRLREMTQVALWMLTAVLSWVSLPVLWYALYRM
jgi:hypothetical protein